MHIILSVIRESYQINTVCEFIYLFTGGSFVHVVAAVVVVVVVVVWLCLRPTCVCWFCLHGSVTVWT